MMVRWANDGLLQANDGLLQANDGKMIVNDGEMLVNDGEMSVGSYTQFTIINEYFSGISLKYTMHHSLIWPSLRSCTNCIVLSVYHPSFP